MQNVACYVQSQSLYLITGFYSAHCERLHFLGVVFKTAAVLLSLMSAHEISLTGSNFVYSKWTFITVGFNVLSKKQYSI